MRITVIGSGYVGLVVGACLADVGNKVICADIDEKKVECLRRGEVPFFEPGLANIVQRTQEAHRLKFTTNVEEACRQGAVIFIAVGTPQGDDGSAELRFVDLVAHSISEVLESGENLLIDGHKIILTKSTVPVGTTAKISKIIGEKAKIPYICCSNPEFLKEGDAVNDFTKPDRVVVGVPDGEKGEIARRVLKELYEPFCRTRDKMLFMNVQSSEMTKYAANALLATKISFMNDLACLAERVGADIEFVRQGIGSDPRIGFNFLFPGTGYGGSCFPKDVKALVFTGNEKGHKLRILEAVEAVNADQKKIVLNKVLAHFNNDVAGKTFAVWGLAFKPRTDDMRYAPSIDLIRGLVAAGAKIRGTDPESMENAKFLFADLGDAVQYFDDEYECAKGADALCVVTEWSQFRRPDWDVLSSTLKEKLVFDGRNLYDPDRMAEQGYTYYAIGRGLPLPV